MLIVKLKQKFYDTEVKLLFELTIKILYQFRFKFLRIGEVILQIYSIREHNRTLRKFSPRIPTRL